MHSLSTFAYIITPYNYKYALKTKKGQCPLKFRLHYYAFTNPIEDSVGWSSTGRPFSSQYE